MLPETFHDVAEEVKQGRKEAYSSEMKKRISDLLKKLRSTVEEATGLADNATDLCEGTIWEEKPLEFKEDLEETHRKIDDLIDTIGRW